ncbi:mannan-binding lectin serine protease 1-like [Glandiceps talaboti]
MTSVHQDTCYITVGRFGKHVWLMTILFCVLLSGCIHGDQGYSSGGFYRADDEDETDGCSETINVNVVQGQLTSPQYPDPYPSDLDCDWLLVAAPGEHVNIQFGDVDIEREDYCQYDYLTIYDGPDDSFNQIGSYCGTEEPPEIFSTNRHLYITFHSDGSDGGRGFSLDHVVTTDERDDDVAPQESEEQNDPDEEQGCNRRLTDAEGIIQSPNYPNRYPGNSDCIYVIRGSDGSRISLTFLDLATEGFGCSFDYVIVKDGDNEDADEIDRFCGNTIPEPVLSTGNSITIHFISDGSDNRDGFRIQYRQQASGQQVHGGLSFTTTPENQTVELGQSVSQRCTVNQNDIDITWLKDGVVLPPGETDGIYILDDGVLIIPTINEDHLAKYTCLARGTDGGVITSHAFLHFVILNTVAPAPDIFEDIPEGASLAEDDDHVFTCRTKRGSDTTVVWEKDGQQIGNDPRIYITALGLMIGSVLPSDSGRYTCIALNRNGDRVAETSATLTVTAKKSAAEICGKILVDVDSNDDTGDSDSADDRYRIIDGKVSVRGSAPWMARIWHNHNRRHFCGGSVLNEYWIITAAHCLIQNSDANTIQVRLGDHDDLVPEPEERLYDVAQIVINPDYEHLDYDGDIALLRLATKIEFTDYVLPICLPGINLARDMLKRRQIGRVLGWGRTIENGAYPRYLNEVNVPIRRTKECRESAAPHLMTSNMFCAGFKRALTGDACKGDSGGPFVEERNNTWYIVGIVSWGEGCSRENEFGFYTKVYKFNSWIESVTRQ